MRDEDAVQKMADKAAGLLSEGRIDPHDEQTLLVGDKAYDVERLRGIKDALDWVIEDDLEDDSVLS